MAGRVSDLFGICPVCVISGGDWPQFQTQVVDRLPTGTRLDNLYADADDRRQVLSLRWRLAAGLCRKLQRRRTPSCARRLQDSPSIRRGCPGKTGSEEIWGDQIEDRGTQITFSGLGQKAPAEAKDEMGSGPEKAQRPQGDTRQALPDLSVRIGGPPRSTSRSPASTRVMACAVLSEQTGFALNEMMFVGDALYPGGNDAPARDAGVPTVGVKRIDDTRILIPPSSPSPPEAGPPDFGLR